VTNEEAIQKVREASKAGNAAHASGRRQPMGLKRSRWHARCTERRRGASSCPGEAAEQRIP